MTGDAFPFLDSPARLALMSLEDFLSEHTQPQPFAAGELIVSQGAAGRAAYYVLDGFVRVFRPLGEKEALVARLGPGSIFGEMALLRYDTHTLSVRAETDGRLAVIPPALLAGELRRTPPLVRAILDMMIDRVNETNEALMDLDSGARP